ncbi:hypothetical protein EFY79_00880 [Hanamia caeni]|uniref:Uncharacterized protein n=1 Tax=Hanamia caeni TaxID=2294116 RepID=A0A3M9NQ24_9BACT|nr:hypothetical protein [Hanamia caeni]RNI39890.1 hypothetical protein EFY79_00880 [Hanamia caeni]
MKQKKYFVLVLALFISSNSFSQKVTYTVNEQKEMNLFFDFKNYIISNINQKADVTDSAHLEYLLEHFLFINIKGDSLHTGQLALNEIPAEKTDYLKKSINELYNYLVENKEKKLAENLAAIPIQKSKDTFICNKFNSFQKENCLVFFDKRHPDKTLGYMLFIPPIKNANSQIKIWSWSLGFKFSKFYFTSLLGEEGYEYMFGDK